MNILIVAHDFPPFNSSAARRPYSWARAWTELGHQVHVLTTTKYAIDGSIDPTVDVSGLHVHQADYLPARLRLDNVPATSSASLTGTRRLGPVGEWLRRATRGLRQGLGPFAQTSLLAVPAMVGAGRQLLAQHRFDFLISTSGPEMCSLVGRRLARASGLPWILDYRDVWFPEFTVDRWALTTYFTGMLNEHLIRDATLISTVSPGIATYLEPIAPGRVIVSYNGYLDELLREPAPPRPLDGRFRVVYTGNFFRGRRDPTQFLEAVASLARSEPPLASRIMVDFYGPSEPWLHDLVSTLGLGAQVRFHGMVKYADSLEAQRNADLLLFLDWLDVRLKGGPTGKVFEYLVAGRPVLCVGNRDATEPSEIIRTCGVGATARNVRETEEALKGFMRGSVQLHPDRPAIAAFSRRGQAVTLLGDILKRLGAA